jgi:hypothetical protein
MNTAQTVFRPTAFDWRPPTLWRCPICSTAITTRDAEVRYPTCGHYDTAHWPTARPDPGPGAEGRFAPHGRRVRGRDSSGEMVAMDTSNGSP